MSIDVTVRLYGLEETARLDEEAREREAWRQRQARILRFMLDSADGETVNRVLLGLAPRGRA